MPTCCAYNTSVPSTCSCGRIVIDPEYEDEALTIFSKYQSSFARRLKKPEAMNLLMTEFGLNENEAEIMFQAFDKDHNEVLSLWEFRQFYQTIGSNGHEMIQLFKKLEEGDSGNIDMEKAFDALKTVETAKGQLSEEEIEMFLKTTAGESKTIDLHKFLNLMCRLKVYKG
ncbi:calmodulin-beta-like [Plakobranchus ocellatus]|uniref:Calmodulin-beta-like n=1 Tax=Plakobranchus ocellatus TaxID=259542 RepID=A0AAV4BN60_9GAST|nr:calmodulin-beta-like [Plakobranchus ocellatus]